MCACYNRKNDANAEEVCDCNFQNRSFKKHKLLNKRISFTMLFILIPKVSSQQIGGGLFPGIKDLSSFKPITATSTCGFDNQAMQYCISSLNNNSLNSCSKQQNRRTCLFSCCANCGSSMPQFVDLDKLGSVTNGVYISADKRSGGDVFSNSKEFINGYMSYSQYPSRFNFSFAGWVKLKEDKQSALVEKQNVFIVKIQEYKMEITYYTQTSTSIPNTIKFVNINLKLNTWHHLALVVCGHDLSLFVDSKMERTEMLSGILNDKVSDLRLGQNFRGYEQFSGLLQELKMFDRGLTNREVVEAMTGKLPDIPYTNCRCPQSHPRLLTTNSFYCMKNSGTGATQLIQRLSPESHPVEYLVDGEVITYWLSELVEDVTIDIDLKYSRLHIYLVSIMFYSPPPMGMKIERSLDFGKTYQTWQYFAVDCMSSFNMTNNGVLKNPDSINCLQITSPKPTWETITFQPAEPGPENKPQRPFGSSGCSDFHCSEKLLEFVRATNVRIVFKGHSLVTYPNHRYFGVRRIIVGGTCDCFGHGTDCKFNDTNKPHPNYKCVCEPRTFTQGDQCDQCKGLYHDKKFSRGTVLDANACKKCECYNHADTCYYDAKLDMFPLDRTKLGGGVCVNCKHNTIGRFCDQCKLLYYRPTGKRKNAVDVCQPCDCMGPGTKVGYKGCQKDDITPGLGAGQCTCKLYATGRQCTQCRNGYFQLSSLNPEGCIRCQCNTDGTLNNAQTCHISSGQCVCKQNVLGVKCTNCKIGYYGLDPFNPLGCTACNCNPLGSDLFASCNVRTGQCKCKDKFEGKSCDKCKAGFYGPTCQPCLCNMDGTVQGSSSICNEDTGKCDCKLYVDGKTCDRCKIGHYGLSKNNLDGCTSCNCDVKGTIGNNGDCSVDGSCTCKALVTGRKCNSCQIGSYALNASNSDGCTKCNCNARGTVSGDRITEAELTCTVIGQCSCISNVIGLQCNQCIKGYYWNHVGLGCLPCNCDTLGSQTSVCNSTGHCSCKTGYGIGGVKCNKCQPGYYNYQNGRCGACSCSVIGSVQPHCDGNGKCLFCKSNVEGFKCDTCKSNTTDLRGENPLGCSGSPTEQSPPFVVNETSRSILLSWHLPDNINGIISKYELYRNDALIYVGLRRSFNDTGLAPYSTFTYYLKVFTRGGSARSLDNLVHSTLSDIPEGLLPPIMSNVKERSVVATWKPPSFPNGFVSRYTLNLVTTSGFTQNYYNKIGLSYQLTGLSPFTLYYFTVSACNIAGCATSANTSVSTRSTAPDSQPAPYTTSLPGGKSVLVRWDEPAKPNGEIQFYDIYIRKQPFYGEGDSAAAKLNPKVRNYTVDDLKPYSEYEFRIVSYTAQVKGSAKSSWTKVRTLEGAPSGASQISPMAVSFTSTTLNITWKEPLYTNGIITRYEIYMYDESSNYLFPVLKASAGGTSFTTQVKGLQAYTKYQISIKACNSVGCTSHSYKVTALTNPSAPVNQPAPVGVPVNSSSIRLQWLPPSILNGPPKINMLVERTLPPFNTPPEDVTDAIRFPGFGFFRFPGSLIPDSSNTLIEFYFKTRYLDGIMFFASSVNQGDIMVIEFRDGCPWFVFDTESGSTAFSISKNRTFNENKWHHVLITRTSRTASILIDGTYSGSGFAQGTKNVIGQISNVFIGALPERFRITRKDDGNMTLKRMPFIGCIKSLKYKNQLVDFDTAIETYNTPPLSSFCPSHNEAGLYFQGGGYLVLKPGIFKGVQSFQISFQFRTLDKTAPLILVADSNSNFFALYFKDQILTLQYKTLNSVGFVMPFALLSPLCDGKWHSITLGTVGRVISSNIDGVTKTITTLPIDFLLAAHVLIGGVPGNDAVAHVLMKTLDIQNKHFTGCMSKLKIGTMIYLPGAVQQFHNVEFDGCPSNKGYQSHKICSSQQVETVYTGQGNNMTISGMKTFTEYLFRVKSYHLNTPGFALSKWVPLRTGQGAPQSMTKPSVTNLNATSATVTWTPPLISGGLIIYYLINSYSKLSGINETTKVVGDLSGGVYYLSPATLYGFTVSAYTSSGVVESPSVQVKTKAAAPAGFMLPVVISTHNTLKVSWKPPLQANGDIIFYQVELNNKIKYNGTDVSVVVTGLTVYTKYVLKVTVCGEVACTSNTLDVYTGELSPFGVIAPQLHALGSRRVEVKWVLPTEVNGVITRYEILLATTTDIFKLRSAFNGSATTFRTVISNLLPATLYYFRVKAFTNAGGTLGDASSIQTVESAPENIPNPVITKKTPNELTIQVLRPLAPNGVINRYVLLQGGVTVLDQISLPAPLVIKNLQPYTMYEFQVKVCTSKGCGLTDPMEVYTLHGRPVGTVGLVTFGVTSSTVEAMWNAIATPNGPITYKLIASGVFFITYTNSFQTYNGSKVCYRGSVSDKKVLCEGLLPFEKYSLLVNGSNDAGFVLSNHVVINTYYDVPFGVSSPDPTVINSSTIVLSWKPPSRSNGEISKYVLYLRSPINTVTGYEVIQVVEGMMTQYQLTGLKPFTRYVFWIVVHNNVGRSTSKKINATTMEDVPSGFDPPRLAYVNSRKCIIHILLPSQPNGIIVKYITYLNNTVVNQTKTTNVHITGLIPYTWYSVHVGACTKIGCFNSSMVAFKTFQDVPEGMAAPILLSNSSNSVVIKWSKPSVLNGVIIRYLIQRRVSNTNTMSTIGSLEASFWNTYVDTSVQPYTSYEYRVVAETEAGGAPSLFNTITTLQGNPQGVNAPQVTVLSPNSIVVKWKTPSRPNGVISSYFIEISGVSRRVEDISKFEQVIYSLQSYVKYDVAVRVCTKGGGCSGSPVVTVRTLPSPPMQQQSPTAEVLSNTSLRVRWKEPLLPNGPIKYYILEGKLLEITSPWSTLVQSTATVYDHVGLGIYSLQQYKVTCISTEGSVTSLPSTPYRTGPGYPLSGPTVNASVINHTSVYLEWVDPRVMLLRGHVLTYTVFYEMVQSPGMYLYGTLAGNVSEVVVGNLRPSTLYEFTIELYNGAGSKSSLPVRRKTFDGIPEGIDPPVIYFIDARALKIYWTKPRVPNGNIVNYTIIANDAKLDTVSGNVTFHFQKKLNPYTNYVIKIQVCTQFICILSEGATVETKQAAPTDLTSPQVVPLSSRSLQVTWISPLNPNGIMIGYQLFRRGYDSCAVKVDTLKKCSYITCSIHEQLCGTKCFDPKKQKCCGLKLYLKDATRSCCDDNYEPKNGVTDVCCGGRFYPAQLSYQCCYGYYRQVPNDHVCCKSSSTVVVGIGNSCCGDVPYNVNGSKVCLCNALYDRYPAVRQCCGGKVISLAEQCCGNDIKGMSYTFNEKKKCCGDSYVERESTLCCQSDIGTHKVHTFQDSVQKSRNKCCGLNTIPTQQACCASIGYDNQSRVCADRSSIGKSGCANGNTCPYASRKQAYCNECNFDTSKSFCYHVNGFFNASNPNQTTTNICLSPWVEILQNNRDASLLSYVDKFLVPHTKYEYYVVGFNTIGNVTSPFNSGVTLMSGPDQIDPPTATLLSNMLIKIKWSAPKIPNGVIKEYILYRVHWSSKQERLVYRGLSLSHLDSKNLIPYTGYMYIISACTNVCTNQSADSLVYTDQYIPSGVYAPQLHASSPTAVQVKWRVPASPNGVITKYDVKVLRNGTYVSVLPANSLGEMMSITVQNLLPFTLYTFLVEACTVKGCSVGPSAAIKTLESAPEGVPQPRIFIRSSRIIEVEWSPPVQPNGVIRYYLLYRNASVLTNQSERTFIDGTVTPNLVYSYFVQAYSNGGFGTSDQVVIRIPESSPQGIDKPTLHASSSSTLVVTWTSPSAPNGQIIGYSVLYQEQDSVIVKKNVGLLRSTTLNGLKPYTEYHIRVTACTSVGCSTGEKNVIRTLEATPVGILPPIVTPKSSRIIEVSWSFPEYPNGRIRNFQVERRRSVNGLPFIIYYGLATTYLDTQLEPFTRYEYRVRADNSVGNIKSDWKAGLTFDGVPGSISAPKVDVINSTHVLVQWDPPGQPNGVVKEYSIRARRFSQIGNESLIQCCIATTLRSQLIGKLQPAVSYEFQILATTSGGSGFGPWTVATTPDALPSGIPVLKVNTNPDGLNDGKSIEVYWGEPGASNGIVISYILYEDDYVVYQGVKRKSLIRRLEPFTNYTFQLAVCNRAGCSKGSKQVLTSGEIQPRGQLPPTVIFSNSSSVFIEWKSPLFPNGVITSYDLLREDVKKTRRRRAENIIFSSRDVLSYLDTGLQPFSTYRYRIRTLNSRGSVESSWVTVTTDEAPPHGLLHINVTALPGPIIRIGWLPPQNANGVIRYYDVYRNNSRIDSTSLESYQDKSPKLKPSTVYQYYVSACTAAGCSLGKPKSVTTLAIAPQSILPPVLYAVDSSHVEATWKPPEQINDIIQKYQLFLNDSLVPVFEGLALQYTVTGLQTFTKYFLKVAACTSVSCVLSRNAEVMTQEDIPDKIDRPILFSLSAYTIEIRWEPPKIPNGIILYYTLFRDGTLIYNGTDTRHLDRAVSPNLVYSYIVTVFNSAGSRRSPVTYGTTISAGAPKNVSKPMLEALDSYSIKVTWSKPDAISVTRYFILFNNVEVDVGTNLKYVATQLQPYKLYEFRVKACFNLACTTSESISLRTLEASPEQQLNPYFDINSVKETTVKVMWYEPLQPNGLVTKYGLYRRKQLSKATLIYNGPDKSFTDSGPEIVANTQYQYKVVAFNSVGNTSSQWSMVTTTNSKPSGVQPIEPLEITTISFTFKIKQPTEPNGEILKYFLEVFDPQNISLPNTTLTSLRGAVSRLQLFTAYRTRLYACNSIGCSYSPFKTIKTKGTVPSGLATPTIRFKTSRSIGISWQEPLHTFGALKRYEVILSHQCPQSSKPICQSYVRRFDSGLIKMYNLTNLTPYTVYTISVEIENEAGTALSPIIISSTYAEAPITVENVLAAISPSSPNTILIDWSKTFDLRSELVEFVVYENLLETFSGNKLKLERAKREVGLYTYSVKAVTKVAGVLTSVTSNDATVAVGTVLPTSGTQIGGDQWYTTLWFLALCAIIILIIIIIIALCCCRGYRRNRSVYRRQREPLPVKSKVLSRDPSIHEFDEKQLQHVSFTPSRRSVSRYRDKATSKSGTPSSSRYRINHEMLGPSLKESRFNESYTENEDLVWDTHSRRDLDSGLYDGSPSPLDDDQLATGSNTFFTVQKERILFPDTHL